MKEIEIIVGHVDEKVNQLREQQLKIEAGRILAQQQMEE